MKDFGNSIEKTYKEQKELFNEFYFKKAVAATIIFRTVDSYLDKLKRVPGSWYTVGGYKLNIVPYSIAKIISCIPQGYSIDWLKIWQKQSVSSAFMREIEIVTKFTNDFICDSHGVIVTEYCKRSTTWEEFRRVPYKLSDEFLRELIRVADVDEQVLDAKKEQKEINSISVEIQVVRLGAAHWKHLLDEGTKANELNEKEKSLLRVGADMERTGKLPSPAQANAMMTIKRNLDDKGIV